MIAVNDSLDINVNDVNKVGEWFAVGTVFTPFNLVLGDEVLTGIRDLVCIDVYSRCIVDNAPLKIQPSTLGSSEALFFVTKVMTEVGMPEKGFVFLESAYLSSEDLLASRETQKQGGFLQDIGCRFPAMRRDDKDTIKERLSLVDLKVSFQQLPPIEAVVTGAFLEMNKKENRKA